MKRTLALKLGNKPISANRMVVVKANTVHSNTNQIAVSYFQEMYNGIENNLYADISSKSLAEDKYMDVISELATEFDKIIGRIPNLMSMNYAKVRRYLFDVKKSTGIAHLPSNLMLSIANLSGISSNSLEYYVNGPLVSIFAIIYLKDFFTNVENLESKSFADVSSLINKMRMEGYAHKIIQSCLMVKKANETMNKKKPFITETIIHNHVSVINSITDDIVNAAVYSSLDGDTIFESKSLLSDIIHHIKEYALLCASGLQSSAKELNVDSSSFSHLSDIQFDKDTNWLNVKESKLKTILAETGNQMYAAMAQNNEVNVESYDLNKNFFDDIMGAYKPNFTNTALANLRYSIMSEEENGRLILADIKALGLTNNDLMKFITYLFDMFESLGKSSPLSNQKSLSITEHINKLNNVSKAYLRFLTSLVGADDNNSRLFLSDFLKNGDWLESFSSTLFGNSIIGKSARIIDLSEMLKSFTTAKDGVSSQISTKYFDLALHKDPLVSLSSKMLGGCTTEFNISEEYLSSDVSKSIFSDKTKSSSKAEDVFKSNDLGVQIEHIAQGQGSDLLSSSLNNISVIYDSLFKFLNSGNPNDIPFAVQEMADSIMPYVLTNFISDPKIMASIGKQSGLILGEDFTISQDARKAILDRVGIIDSAITHYCVAIEKAITLAYKMVLAVEYDKISTIDSIMQARTELMDKANFRVNVAEMDVVSFDAIVNSLDTLANDVFGGGLSARSKAVVSDSSESLFIAGIGGATNSAYESIKAFNRIFDRFDSNTIMKLNKRKVEYVADKFTLLRTSAKHSLRTGGMIWNNLWLKGREITQSHATISESNYNLSDIMSASIISDHMVNSGIAELVHRGPSQARLTSVVKLTSLVETESSNRLKDITTRGRFTVMEFLRKVVKSVAFKKNNHLEQIGAIAASLSKMSRQTKYVVNGVKMGSESAASMIFASYKNQVIINRMDLIVQNDLISMKTFPAIDLKTISAPTENDVTFNLLRSLGLNPYSMVRGLDAVTLLTYVSVRMQEKDFPFVPSSALKRLIQTGDALGDIQLINAVNVKKNLVKSSGSSLINYYYANVYVWDEAQLSEEDSFVLLDSSVNLPTIVADGQIAMVDGSSSNITACAEVEVDINYGEIIQDRDATSYLMGIVEELNKLV